MGDADRHPDLVHNRVWLLSLAAFFIPHEGAAKLILGGIDGLLGRALKAVVYYLFPQSSKGQE
jgi:hypothetical protein